MISWTFKDARQYDPSWVYAENKLMPDLAFEIGNNVFLGPALHRRLMSSPAYNWPLQVGGLSEVHIFDLDSTAAQRKTNPDTQIRV